MIKKLSYILLGVMIATMGVAVAAPTIQYFVSISPFVDNTYDNGDVTHVWKNVWTNTLHIPSLSDGCLYILSGTVTSNVANPTCTSGGGGGSGSGTVGTSTPLVAGQVDFSTGVSTIGNDSTFLFSTAFKRLTTQNASTTVLTVSGASYIPQLANLTSNGIVYTSGSNGTLNVIATSTLTGTGLISVTSGAYILGGTPIVVSCSTCGAGTVTAVTGTWPIVSSGGATPNITYEGLGTTTDTGIGNNLILYTSNTGIIKGVASSSLSLPNAALQNSTISGVALGGTLFALNNDATLNGSAYTGASAISDWGLNLANPNTWTVNQTFNYSSSTIYSSFLTASTTFLRVGLADGCLNITSGLVGSTGLACGSGSGSSAFDIATRTDIAVPGVAYFTKTAGLTTLGSVATGTVSAGSSAITVTAGRSVLGGALAIDCATAGSGQNGCLSSTDWSTFNNKQATIGVTWPITLSGATIGFNGLSTTTAIGIGQILYGTGVNTVGTVATGTVTCTGTVSCGAGSYVIGSNLTITGSGGSGSSKWATSTDTYTIYPTGQMVSIGTTTSRIFPLVVASSTQSQIALGDGLVGNPLYALRVAGGNFYLSTTTVQGLSTSTRSAMSVMLNGSVGIATNTPTLSRFTVEADANQTGAFITGSNNGFLELMVQNRNTGNSASSDFVATANNGDPSFHYIDMGINGSGGGSAPFTTANDAYLYSIDDPLNIGAVSLTGGITRLFAGGGMNAPVQIANLNSNGFQIGTTTSRLSTLTVGSSTAPQLTLSDNKAGDMLWTLRNAGTDLFFSTTTAQGTATTSPSALKIQGTNGYLSLGTTTSNAKLSIDQKDGFTQTVIPAEDAGLSGVAQAHIRSTMTVPCTGGSLGGSGICVFYGTFAEVVLDWRSNPAQLQAITALNGIITVRKSDTAVNPAGTGFTGGSYGIHYGGSGTLPLMQALLASNLKLGSGNVTTDTGINVASDYSAGTGGTVSNLSGLLINTPISISGVTTGTNTPIKIESQRSAAGTQGGIFPIYQVSGGGGGGIIELNYFGSKTLFGSTTSGTNGNNTARVLPGLVNISTSTTPQLTIDDGGSDTPWSFRTAGSNFYLATSGVNTMATSTNASLAILSTGVVQLGNYADCTGLTNALKINTKSITCEAVTSDERLKKDFNAIDPEDALSKVLAMKPYTFYFIDNNIPGYDTHSKTMQSGNKAQDLQKIIPSAVSVGAGTEYTPDGTLIVDNSQLGAYYEGAIQALYNRVNKIKGGAEPSNWKFYLLGGALFVYIVWNEYDKRKHYTLKK